MLNKALEAFGELKDDEELGPADWITVKKYITCLNDLDNEPEHPHDVGDRDDRMQTMNLTDIRVRLLNGMLSLIRLSDGILYKYFFCKRAWAHISLKRRASSTARAPEPRSGSGGIEFNNF